MANCPTCGASMLRFENPPREICPNLPHAKTGTVRPGVKRRTTDAERKDNHRGKKR